MAQAHCLDGLALYLLALLWDFRCPSMVGICRRSVAQALMVSAVIIMLDEGGDPASEVAGQVIVFEKDTVFQGLMPSFDFYLSLWKARCAANMFDVSSPQPFGKAACDLTRSVIREQARLVLDFG